jgi:hypothetical protein
MSGRRCCMYHFLGGYANMSCRVKPAPEQRLPEDVTHCQPLPAPPVADSGASAREEK